MERDKGTPVPTGEGVGTACKVDVHRGHVCSKVVLGNNNVLRLSAPFIAMDTIVDEVLVDPLGSPGMAVVLGQVILAPAIGITIEQARFLEQVHLLCWIVLVNVTSQIGSEEVIHSILNSPESLLRVESEADFVSKSIGKDLPGGPIHATRWDVGHGESNDAGMCAVLIDIGGTSNLDIEESCGIEDESASHVMAAWNVLHNHLSSSQVGSSSDSVSPSVDLLSIGCVKVVSVDCQSVVEAIARLDEDGSFSRSAQAILVQIVQNRDLTAALLYDNDVAIGLHRDGSWFVQAGRILVGTES